MATYKEIQAYVKKKYGYVPKTCWIAHAKDLSGIPVRKAHNRIGERMVPCPASKVSQIRDAFFHFGLLP